MTELPAEWADAKMALLARDILDSPSRYGELSGQRVHCRTHKRDVVARFYTGAHPEEPDRVRLWAVTMPIRRGGSGRSTVPALAAPVPDRAGEIAWTMNAECRRCKLTYLLFLAGLPPEIEAVRAAGQGGYVVVRYGPPTTQPTEVGDETSAHRLVGFEDGPRSVVLAVAEPPTYGRVAAGDQPTAPIA